MLPIYGNESRNENDTIFSKRYLKNTNIASLKL